MAPASGRTIREARRRRDLTTPGRVERPGMAEPPQANPIEHDRQEHVDDLVGHEDAAEDGGGHRADDLAGDPAREEHRGEADDDRRLGEELGAEPVDGAVEDGPAEAGGVDRLDPAARSRASRR